MSLLQLAHEINLAPKRVASTNGGEYHSPCPSCGGKDRFIIWEKSNRYYCRQCCSKGDAIQFCRDFMGLSYGTACEKLRESKRNSFHSRPLSKQKFEPHVAKLPSHEWQKQATDFAQQCHEKLMASQDAMQLLQERGFSVDMMKALMLGWNDANRWFIRSEWGLESVPDENNHEKKLWIPKGIVIPTLASQTAIKLKIRRSDWIEGDKLPKYVEVSGSMNACSIYGNHQLRPVIIVESELDAMLIQQFAKDICCCVALGGAGKRPDSVTDLLVRQSEGVLVVLDFDEAGKKAYQFWKSLYPHIRPWAVPKGKSPGDAYKLGVDLRKWVLNAVAKMRE